MQTTDKTTLNQLIFVVVFVNYDWYRFQENIGAATDIEVARKLANDYVEGYVDLTDLPVIEGDLESSNLDDSETPHIWIQKMTNGKAANL